MRLATCTFQEFQPDMGIPVRTTVGAPRFTLDYELAGHALGVTPTRPMLSLTEEPYRVAYRARLDAFGVNGIRVELEGIAAVAGRRQLEGPLVLLCFDRLDKLGAWCHRRMFAEWWLERTGEEAPELGARPGLAQQPALFD